MHIPKLEVGDIIEMKKAHPCGKNAMRIARVGSDIRLICEGCGRDLTLPREKAEKAIRHIISNDLENHNE